MTLPVSYALAKGWPIITGRAAGANDSALTALQSAMVRPIDVVMLGDSNQDKDGFGFSWSWSVALIAKAGMYATPIGYYPTLGGNATYGWPFGVTPPPTTVNPTTGASATQIPWAFPDAPSSTGAGGASPGGTYGYLADGATVAAGSGTFSTSVVNSPGVDVKARWRCTYFYSTFATGAGSWRPFSRGTSNFAQLALGASIPTNTGAETRQSVTLDIAADPARTQGFEFQWKQHNVSPVTGPFLGFGSRAENLDKNTGFSMHRLYGVGGQSMYDVAYQLLTWSDAQLTNFFAETRRLQISRGFDPVTICLVNFGLNDLNESLQPSLGPNPSSSPQSAAAYIDNFEAAVNRVRAIYTLNGWSLSGLKFIICPSHPITDVGGNATLNTYREAAAAFAASRQDTSFINIASKITPDQMLANVWYLSGGADYNHLTGPTTKPASGTGSTPPYGYDGIVALMMPVLFPS
jgi:hypothetical protein